MPIEKMQITNKGFTLLEVLVALLVLSIGLLGIAGLQASSLQYNLEASTRSQVTILTEDILSKIRMRTNMLENDDIAAEVSKFLVSESYTAGACVLNNATISNDLNCWLSEISNLLPSGKGLITTANGRDITITIRWFEQGARSYTVDAAQATGVAGDDLREGLREFSIVASL